MAHWNWIGKLSFVVSVLVLGAFTAGDVEAEKTHYLKPPQRLVEITLKPHDAPVDLPIFVGWLCQSASKTDKNSKPIDWSYLNEILVEYVPPKRPLTKQGDADAAADKVAYMAAERRVHAFLLWHEENEDTKPREYFRREFKLGDFLLPNYKLNPAQGQTLSVYFHGCVTDADLAVAQKAASQVEKLLRSGKTGPMPLDALPAGVTLEVRAHRQRAAPGYVRSPAAAVGSGVAGSIPAPRPITAGGAVGGAPLSGTNVNRELPADEKLLRDLTTVPTNIPQRRRESYLAASPPLGDFTGPGNCGQCRRNEMKACFVSKCGGFARTSMGLRNETVPLVAKMNALADTFNDPATGKSAHALIRKQWNDLKRQLAAKDRAFHARVDAENRQLAQCERSCQFAAAQSCDGQCKKARVGDRFSVPLGEESCQPVDTRLTNRPFESRSRILAALAGKDGSGRRIGVADYFAWKAAYETDPSTLQSRADRDPGSVSVRPGKRLARKTTARIKIEPWFQPKSARAASKASNCCKWDRIEGVAVREADYELHGVEYDYDFYVYFTDLQGLEDFAEQYMRPFFAAGARPEPGLSRAARSPVVAERLAKLGDDVIGMARGKTKAIGDTFIHTLRLASDLALNEGLDRVARTSSMAWNLGWSAARLSKQLLSPWMTSIQQKASGTFLENVVGKDEFSALGIERLARRHAYRMRVKGKRFWPDRICQIPRKAYTEVTSVTPAGGHFCGAPNERVKHLYKTGVRNSCHSSGYRPDIAGCWVEKENPSRRIRISRKGQRLFADVEHQNRVYSGWQTGNRFYLEYLARGPFDRASMPWVKRDGSPGSVPVKAIRQTWPASRRSSYVMSGAEYAPGDTELSGTRHGIWIDYDEKQNVTGTSPGKWPANWVREDLKARAVFFTAADFSDPVTRLKDPQRLYVRAVVDNNCRGHVDRIGAEITFKNGSAPIPVTLVETTPYSGEFYSDNDGIPVPAGQPPEATVKLFNGLKGAKVDLRYAAPAKNTPASTPAESDFMKSLNKKIEGLKKDK